jgi:Fic family protein|tara:strand:+ start:2957 stop:3781 length:825 start_codon:yes stop_codon:yes gene_type:complete
MRYISKNLLNEIRRKLKPLIVPRSSGKKIKEVFLHPFTFNCQKNRRKAIEKNAQIHSYKIEYPCLNIPFSVPRNRCKEDIKKGIKNLEEAFNWGRKNFDPKNFNEEFIRKIAKIITPDIYPGDFAEYRDTGTTISGASTTPPYPYKVKEIEIPGFMKYLRDQLKKERLVDRINLAIYSHLHLVRIHPFIDGNGRTSRTIQNIILDHYKLPLPIIEAGERNTYYELLDKAILDWKHKENSGEINKGATEGEHGFYNFMAGKINVSLDKILECNIH